jgi:hypothetical protein
MKELPRFHRRSARDRCCCEAPRFCLCGGALRCALCWRPMRGPILAAILVLTFLNLSVGCAGTKARQGDQMLSTIQIGNSRIDVIQEEGALSVTPNELLDWVRAAVESTSTYYRRFPVPHVVLRIVPSEGQGVRGGRTNEADDGGRIRIHVGKNATAVQLHSDWMLTHEMVHLAFPSVADDHHWIEEGIATYVEPIARVRAKKFDAKEMWFEVVRDLHQGLPAPGDQGLDRTHTWGRTYWGGALFCLLADVDIRKQTNNEKGLDDALRGMLLAGGDIRYHWPLDKALEAADRATGVRVLKTLYDKMKNEPYPVDLPALWQQLGIALEGQTVRFIDAAPLAAVRDGITYGTLASTPNAALDPHAHAVVVGRRVSGHGKS